MITLAFDTATDRCSVAAGDGRVVAHRAVTGARRHAGAILGLIADALDQIGAGTGDIERIVSADGPGSFTGLRVGAAVAKGLAWHREIEWRVAPSLLVRAAAHLSATDGARVLALSDALRGEVYAGCWDIAAGHVTSHGPSPRAMPPGALRQFGTPDVVCATIPPALEQEISLITGRQVIVGDAALPDARQLLALCRMAGGTQRVDDPAGWEPDYGRPAEAQAVWERAHGRPLPVAADHPV